MAKHNKEEVELLGGKCTIYRNDYGVWQLKKFMGREYMGIVRTTFLIDENGVIENINNKVNTKEHITQIL